MTARAASTADGKRKRVRGTTPPRTAALLLMAGLAVLSGCQSRPDGGPTPDELRLLDAFESKRSGFMVTVTGQIDRVLEDDNEGSRHQRFILRLSTDQTLLVSHNIDLAPRAPVRRGGSVTVRGQYEWNDRGGVLHWTHHDPEGRRDGGWIRQDGELYR